MKSNDQIDRNELRRRIKLEDTIADLRKLGIDEATIAPLEAELHSSAPTLTEYLPVVLNALQPGQRKTYNSYAVLLERGAPEMCACTCHRCLPAEVSDLGSITCPCTAQACVCSGDDMVEGHTSCDERFEGLGGTAMCGITIADLKTALRWARSRGRRRQIHRNRRRATKNRAPRQATGASAEEHMASLIRAAWALAAKDPATRVLSNVNDDIRQPARPQTPARHLEAAQLEEVWDVVWNGGDDPELDMLLVWLHLEGGLRRSGGVTLTCGKLDLARQGVRPTEKNDVNLPQPISYRLLRSLVGHALERGDVVAETPEGMAPSNVTVDMVLAGDATLKPDAPVLYFRRTRVRTERRPVFDAHGAAVIDASGRPRFTKEPVLDSAGNRILEPWPLSRRRYNTLFDRIQRALPWADEDGLRCHDLRHTGSVFVERASSYATAKAWLRHSDANPTDTYVKARQAEVADAVGALTGEAHPIGAREN